MRTEWLVMKGLAAATDRTGVDVIGNKGDHLGPIELVANVLDRLSDAGVTCEVVVVAGAKDIYVTTRLRTLPTGPRLTSGTQHIFRPAPWTPDTPTFPRLRGPLSVVRLTRHAYRHAFLPHQRTAHGQAVT